MLDGSAVILGFTGSIGSGCTYISKKIPDISHRGYKYFKLSDIIRDSLNEQGKPNPTVSELQTEGNRLRKEHGSDTLAQSLIKYLKDDPDFGYEYIVVDGIKNDGEVALFRQFPNFYLFSVNADREKRGARVVGLNKPFDDMSKFLEADKKDEFEEDSDGQQVKKCNNVSDIIIVNEKEFAYTAPRSRDDLVASINKKYIELIENNRLGLRSSQISPSVDELCMTIAYSMSKKSSCLKRKVGAVIINSNHVSETDAVEEKAPKVPHIIASGYNEVPKGAYKCIFDREYQMCYRDHLQEEHAIKMKHCPSCGVAIDPVSTCPKCGTEYPMYKKFCTSCQVEIKDPYKCPGCSINVFDEHLPGNKKTPGKLLDLCRALHAEEMAILQLTNNGGIGSEGLVLFVTTQPCNLCANKITTTGIKTVVYDEPYNMKEAAEILNNGGVTLKRFEGVKSSAYFKLYN